MNNIVVAAAGLTVLGIASCLQPMRGWLRDLMADRYLLTFILPLFVLFGWPANKEVFRGGQELGWLRMARIVLFTGFMVLLTARMFQQRSRLASSRPAALVVFSIYTLVAACSSVYSAVPLQTGWKAFELFVVYMFALQLCSRRTDAIRHANRLANALLYFTFAF